MHGFLNIDKPAGMTSFDVIRRLKKCLPRGTRIGHLGTLDPMATGVLPIAIGQATRLIHYLEDDDKEYQGSMTIGLCRILRMPGGARYPTASRRR